MCQKGARPQPSSPTSMRHRQLLRLHGRRSRCQIRRVAPSTSTPASSSPNGSINSYTWAFDDGSTASGPVVDHAYSEPGTYTVGLLVTDTTGQTGRVALSPVEFVSHDPVARDDTATTDEDTPITIDVAANDTDPDDDTITVVQANDGAKGSVSIVSGKLVYTPKPDVTGADTISYSISDGRGGTASVSVVIAITPVNDAPRVVDDAVTTAAGVAAIGNVLGNDLDGDGDALTASVLLEPSRGALQLDASGAFTYTPNPGATGDDSFTYTVGDGHGGAASATVSITITTSAPAAPSVTGVTPDVRSLLVSWSAPPSDGGTPITGYVISATPVGSGAPVVTSVGLVTSGPVAGLADASRRTR